MKQLGLPTLPDIQLMQHLCSLCEVVYRMFCISKCFAFPSLVLVIILARLQYECVRESERIKARRSETNYDPDTTDCVAQLKFPKPGLKKIETYFGPEYVLKQWLPCPVTKMVTYSRLFLYGMDETQEDPPQPFQMKNVTILDARNHPPGSFNKTGFKYLRIEEVG